MSVATMRRVGATVALAVICAAFLASMAGCAEFNPAPPVDLASPIYAAPQPVAVGGDVVLAGHDKRL